jgi:deoxycytidylate deaminase
MQLCTAIHAEERAILSLNGRDARGGTLYTTTFPCFQCARKVIDHGIKTVVYVEAYPIKAAYELLIDNDVQVVPFQGFKARAFNLVYRQVD